jgi:SAM-dependent methyltransferase
MHMANKEIYDTPEDALRATDGFYRSQSGFGYDLKKVTDWLKANVQIPKTGRVLDLCCGDGIWSRGLKELNPALQLYGIDISAGGIERAGELAGASPGHFVVGDVESSLPFDKSSFDLIFARGPGLYNQHDMSRPACVAVIEMWHEFLQPNGQFYSIFASTPAMMGKYTPMEDVVLPFNRAPRHTETIEFPGGKYHHTKETFEAPFLKAHNAKVKSYKFVNNQHVLVTTRKA